MDDELHSYVRQRVAEEHRLPDGWAGRLHGETLRELRDDAHRLARHLGLVEERPRDASGRFAVEMNDLIRGRR